MSAHFPILFSCGVAVKFICVIVHEDIDVPVYAIFIHTGSFPVKNIAPMYCGDLHCMILNYEA